MKPCQEVFPVCVVRVLNIFHLFKVLTLFGQLLWVELCPPKDMLSSKTPVPMDMTCSEIEPLQV